MHEDDFDMEPAVNSKIEYLKLFIIILLIGGVAFFFNQLFGSNSGNGLMRWFMGLFLVTFGTFKFIGYEMFTEMFPSYDIIAAKSRVYTYAYPFIEMFLGIAYLVNAFPTFRDIVALVLFSISAYGIYKTIKTHGNVQCACLGNVIKLPLSAVSLAENVLMAVMAAIMLVL